VRPRKIGTLAMGFIIAKNPIKTVAVWSRILSNFIHLLSR
jgi:hypothetical protein